MLVGGEPAAPGASGEHRRDRCRRPAPADRIGRSRRAQGRRPESQAGRGSRATSACRGWCTARCCASPCARISRSRHLGRREDGGGRRRADQAPELTALTPTGDTRSRTGRSSQSTRSASVASRWPRSPPRTRRPPRPHCARSSSTTTSCRCSARSSRRPPTTPAFARGRASAGRNLSRARRAAGPRGQRLLPLPARRRLGRARGAEGSSRSRASTGSRRLSVRDGDPHRDRGLRRRRDHPLGCPAGTRSWSARIADLFNLPIGRVRVIVPYLGGGFGSKSYTKVEPITAAALLEGRPSGADSRTASRNRW